MMYDVSSIIHHPVRWKSSSILGMDHCHPTGFYRRRQLLWAKGKRPTVMDSRRLPFWGFYAGGRSAVLGLESSIISLLLALLASFIGFTRLFRHQSAAYSGHSCQSRFQDVFLAYVWLLARYPGDGE